MKCLTFLITLTLPLASYGTNWKELSKLNDPAGQPSVRAALVANQGLSIEAMTRKLAQLKAALGKGRSTATGEQISILKREIALIEIALSYTPNVVGCQTDMECEELYGEHY